MSGRSEEAKRLEELVAALHGEGGTGASNGEGAASHGGGAVSHGEGAASHDDPVVQDVLATLGAVDAALEELGAESAGEWPESSSASVLGDSEPAEVSPTSGRLLGWLGALAAAAVLVGVFVVARLDPSLDELTIGRGEDLIVRCTPLHAGHGPLHAELGLHLSIEARDGERVVVPPRDPAAGPSLGDEPAFATLVGGMKEWCVQIDALVRDPEGRELRGFVVPGAVPEEGLSGAPLELDVHLHEIWVDGAAPTPYVTVFEGGEPEKAADPDEVEAADPDEAPQRVERLAVDFARGFRRYGLSPLDGYRPFFPRTPGRHEIELTVRGFWGRSAASRVNPNAAATTVRHACTVDGEASPWSEPVDGLRARLIVPPELRTSDAEWPVALQIENLGSMARRYNVMGSTSAPIPQPLHLRCFVDGREVDQRERLPVLIPAGFFPEHPPGAVFTMLLPPRRAWRFDVPADRDDPLEFAIELDTRPFVAGPDPAIWRGKLRTPPVGLRSR